MVSRLWRAEACSQAIFQGDEKDWHSPSRQGECWGDPYGFLQWDKNTQKDQSDSSESNTKCMQ